jgi:aerobic carbon-monoxide dehydrogenase medium subunit
MMTFGLSGLPSFDYYQPTTIREALQLLHGNPQAKVYLGGTDLFPRLRKESLKSDVLIDLKWINDFPETMINQAGDLIINPQSTFSRLLAYLGELNGGEILSEAIQQLGTRSIRNRATLAGNLCNASPAADSIASLLVYDAILTLQSLEGDRKVAINDFFSGAGKTVMLPDELLIQVEIPAQHPQCRGTYIKLSRNKAADLAICGVAVLLCPNKENKAEYDFRIAVSGANAVPVLASEASTYLADHELTNANLQHAANMAAGSVSPLSDVRSSAQYRKEMVCQLTRQALESTLLKFGAEVQV